MRGRRGEPQAALREDGQEPEASCPREVQPRDGSGWRHVHVHREGRRGRWRKAGLRRDAARLLGIDISSDTAEVQMVCGALVTVLLWEASSRKLPSIHSCHRRENGGMPRSRDIGDMIGRPLRLLHAHAVPWSTCRRPHALRNCSALRAWQPRGAVKPTWMPSKLITDAVASSMIRSDS